MSRFFWTSILGLCIRVFYYRIEIFGQNNVPDGSVVYVLNHPNALVDPGFILCYSERRVSFLAKAPLFSMPLLGWIVRSLECLPVYRKADAADPAKNRRTFETARSLLTAGNAIAVFPEGTSHCDPKLRPLKSGAARIALGAASLGDGDPVHVVPVGLYYSDKGTFRSHALVYYGKSFPVYPVEIDENLEPPRDAVREVTAKMTEALAQVTIQADEAEAHHLVERVQGLFARRADTLVNRFELRQQLMEGYRNLKRSFPARLEALVQRVEDFETECREFGLNPRRLDPDAFEFWPVARFTLTQLGSFVFLLPLAVVGVATHIWPYLLIHHLGHYFSRVETDVLASAKMLISLAAFPLTWAGMGVGVGYAAGWQAGVATALSGSLIALATLMFMERSGKFRVAAKALLVFVTRKGEYRRLVGERADIRAEILALADTVAEGIAPGLAQTDDTITE